MGEMNPGQFKDLIKDLNSKKVPSVLENITEEKLKEIIQAKEGEVKENKKEEEQK